MADNCFIEIDSAQIYKKGQLVGGGCFPVPEKQ